MLVECFEAMFSLSTSKNKFAFVHDYLSLISLEEHAKNFLRNFSIFIYLFYIKNLSLNVQLESKVFEQTHFN